MQATCRDCRFWDTENPPESSHTGLCRRHSPVVLTGPRGGNDGLLTDRWGYWPQTVESDFCGEFVERSGVKAVRTAAQGK